MEGILYAKEYKPTDGDHANRKDSSLEMDSLRKRSSAANGKEFIPLNEFEDRPRSENWLSKSLASLNSSTELFVRNNRRPIKWFGVFLLNGIVWGFFVACLIYWLEYGENHLELCHGFGSLIALLSFVYFFVIYFLIVKRYCGKFLNKLAVRPVKMIYNYLWAYLTIRLTIYALLVAGIAIFLFFDTRGETQRLISLLGLVTLILAGFIFSAHPSQVSWRAVVWGALLQFVFGLLTIRWEVGRSVFQCIGDKVATFLGYGVEGAAFVFGNDLVHVQSAFAFSVLPVIFFFSMIVETLFYWGAIQWFCMKLGGVLQALCGTTVCESVIAVSNVFLGNTESVLMIKPYLSMLTESEIHTVMASGFATVSGTILAAYISFGAEPAHLITASVMSAPAAICYAKLLLPETKISKTSVETINLVTSEDQSALSAATRGATQGISLILNIIANLVAFIALVAFINGMFGYCGGLLGFEELNLEYIFGKIFIPLAWLMGVPWEECENVAILIGLKTVVNEFVAYQQMGIMKEANLLSPRAEAIATYALCGFTNPGSGGIMIGALSAIAPNQRETLAKVAVRAFFAGCAICFMTACIAGLLMPEGSFVGSATNATMAVDMLKNTVR